MKHSLIIYTITTFFVALIKKMNIKLLNSIQIIKSSTIIKFQMY